MPDHPFTDEEQLAFAQRLDGRPHSRPRSSVLYKSRLGNEAVSDISNVDEYGHSVEKGDLSAAAHDPALAASSLYLAAHTAHIVDWTGIRRVTTLDVESRTSHSPTRSLATVGKDDSPEVAVPKSWYARGPWDLKSSSRLSRAIQHRVLASRPRVCTGQRRENRPL